MHKSARVTATLVAALVIGHGAAAAGMQKVSVALPVTSLTFSPNYVAEAEGFWKKQGLDVTLHNIAGVGAMNAVLAGSIDFSNSSGPVVLRANIRGAKVQGIGVLLNGLPLAISVPPGMLKKAGLTLDSPVAARAKLLKGKTVTVVAPNTIPHIYLRYFARKGGLDPERDLTVTSMSPVEGLAALKSGRVQGYVQSAPWPQIAEKEGVGVYLSVARDLPEFSPLAYNVVVTKTGFCDTKPDICTRMMAGYAEAMKFMHDHPEKAVTDLHAVMKRVDADVIASALKLIAGLTPSSTKFSLAELEHAQDLMIAGGMIKSSERLASFDGVYTNKYAK